MKYALRLSLLALLLLLLAGLLAVAAALQSQPAVVMPVDPDHRDVARAMELVRQHDPRRSRPGMFNVATLSERDLEVLINHGGHRWLNASTQVTLQRGTAQLRSSLRLPDSALNCCFGRWLNVQLRLVETSSMPVIDSVQVGSLPLPAALGEWLGLQLARRAGLLNELQLAGEMLQRVRFDAQALSVLYAWQPENAQRMANALLPPAELERLRAYTELLAQHSERAAPGWTLSLAPLLGPLFQLAQQRSAAGGDAVAENRAVLSVLTLYANGRGLHKLVPAARSWPRPRPLRLTLAGREDTPLHWLVSAALAAESTGPLAKAIGIYKEVADSQGGSGFSFNDMAADRAGARVGELAVNKPQQLQALLARGVQEADIMPPAADLPENMPDAEFKRRFGGVGQPAYLSMMAEIERRVDALPVLR
jgi:hypothetical protein